MPLLYAYPLQPFASVANGTPKRKWMDATFENFAYGCLPLLIANQMGWDMNCETAFKARWNGGDSRSDIEIVFEDENDPFNAQVMSHTGYGIITFNPGFLFTTEDDINLIVKGVPNHFKDGIQPLEAVVETDWLPFTFTMNWKFTRANQWINFLKGEPMGRIVPYPRYYIESFEPIYRNINSNPELKHRLDEWGNSRINHNKNLQKGTAEAGTEKNYLQGKMKDGERVSVHQTKIALKPFKKQQ